MIVFFCQNQLDDKEYSGSLVSLLQNGTEFVKNNTKKRWKKTGNGRVEMPEYPEQAVHEVIVNALIHRDYMEIGSEVHIDIFDDRMEVYSPGGMFDGSIVQELDTDNVASKRRNPVIADIFSRMHFMERRGSGFKKIKADYRHAVNYRPEVEPMFRSTPTSFFATLYKRGIDDMKLSDFIGEATEYDKKEILEERKPKSWLKSVSAFANGIGGALFFGVSNDEVLVGLDDAKGVSEKISEAIKTKMDPAPQVILEIHAEDGKDFVVLRVPSGQETPYYYTGDGNRIR